MEYVIAIIGGGASGLAAAIAAAEDARMRERAVRVVLFEASDKVGRSILVSGNGRCNFSNLHIDANEYHNADFVSEVLSAFEKEAVPYGGAPDRGDEPLMPNGVMRFFHSCGLLWRSEEDGRLYPKTNKASSLLDVMRRSLRVAGVDVRLGSVVDRVEPPSDAHDRRRFTIRMRDGSLERADAVVISCGGNVSRSILATDIPFVEPRPMLGPVATDVRWVKPLDNIRVRCAASLVRDGRTVHTEHGELLFRKYGISGIMTFNLSRLAQSDDIILLDFIPDIPEARAVEFLRDRALMLEGVLGVVSWEALLSGMVLPQLGEALIERSGLKAEDLYDDAFAWKLAEQLKEFSLAYKGVGDIRSCQVHRGGFSVEAVDARTMQAHKVPHLFITGEALDVDGPCGGFNLHWAFATGLMAGAKASQLGIHRN